MNSLHLLVTAASRGYELLDSGNGQKLERFGAYTLARPDPQALWHTHLPASDWEKAHGKFRGSAGTKDSSWSLDATLPEKWDIELGGLKFWIRPTSFKHTGIFPEQAANWKWIEEIVTSAKPERSTIKVLNLFGYTGGATLAAAKAGAEVVHVDGSKVAIRWARENAELSGLAEKPIRWILDDVKMFVQREVTRGNVYDGIIMDPPAYGRGAQGEVWKIEQDLPELLALCKKILSPSPLFVIMNGYASGYSSLAYENSLTELMKDPGGTMKGTVQTGELVLEEAHNGRFLPAGIFARWKA